jgi:hypothetical protein
MRLPDHIAILFALRRSGVPVHIATTKGDLPTTTGRQLVLIGDDPVGSIGGGPEAWDGPTLRRLLRSLKPGALGVFAGAPLPSAYEALCFGAASLPRGAVIIEVSGARFVEWYNYTQKHALDAARFDVVPRTWQPPASALHLGTLIR